MSKILGKVDISIIIVNWNAGILLKNCIESIILNTKGVFYEVIVVDNASTKESLKCIEEFLNFDFIKFYLLDQNVGFSKANNIGVHNSRGKYLLFLNPDTLLVDNMVMKLLESYLELTQTHQVGILVPQLLNEDSTIQFSAQDFPIVTLKKITKYIYKKVTKSNRKNILRNTEWARGACFFIPRFLGNSYGFWNEHFILYGEDLELCYRYKRQGYLTIINPKIGLVHYYNQSGKRRFDTYQSLIRKEEGLHLFYNIYLGKFRFLIFEVFMLVKGIVDILKSKDYNRFKLSKEFIKRTFRSKYYSGISE